MGTTAERLNTLMAERSLKQSDIIELARPFCDRWGVKLTKSDMSQYVSGKVEPGRMKLAVLGMALNVNETWLMGYDVPRERDTLPANLLPMPSTRKVPRLGTIACGTPILAEGNIEGYDEVPDWVQCDFTLICKGDSMINARIYNGDIVCIKRQETVTDGQIAAVMIDGDFDSEATLKRVRLFDDHIVLEPENPNVRPLAFWEGDMNRVHIIGLATHFISSVL